MFRLVLRKMLNNRWMVACLTVGLLLAVAMVSAIPLYTDAVTTRMLRRELQILQQQRNRYPGSVSANISLLGKIENNADEKMAPILDKIEDSLSGVTVPLASRSWHMYFDSVNVTRLPTKANEPRQGRVDSFENML